MRLNFALFVAVAFVPQNAAAATQDTGRATVLRDLVACRSLSDEDERLACYDREVSRIDAAERDDRIVVLDKAQLNERARRDFGLNDKNDGADQIAGEPEIDQLETMVETVGSAADGGLAFTTTGGARWEQLDDRHPFGVKPGKKVTLKRALFGTYFADFEGTISIRVKRVR